MTKLLSSVEIEEIAGRIYGSNSTPQEREFARAIEAAVLEAQGKQEPIGVVLNEDSYGLTVHFPGGMPPAGTKLYAAPVVQPDMVMVSDWKRRLCDNITDAVIEGLHYSENAEKISSMQSYSEISIAMDGAVSRYKSEPIFRAKVESFVARIMQAIAAAEKESRE